MKTAFLNMIVDGDLRVTSPQNIPGRPSRCYKFFQSIYSLKEGHCAFHKRLCADFNAVGFAEMRNAPRFFLNRTGDCKQTIFRLVYVDEILNTPSTQKM